MDYKQITELIKLVNKTDISELKIEDKDFKISIRSKAFTEATQKGKMMVSSAAPIVTTTPSISEATPVSSPPPATKTAPTPETTTDETPTTESSNLITIKSPMIGTFYRSSSPDKPPFIKVGDVIEVGTVLCIVEAMKLFNEIESEVSGKVVKVVAENASPVEYDAPLFIIEPV